MRSGTSPCKKLAGLLEAEALGAARRGRPVEPGVSQSPNCPKPAGNSGEGSSQRTGLGTKESMQKVTSAT